MPANYLPIANTHQGTPFRQPLGNREQHTEQQSYSQGGGVYGMSGIKVGRQPNGYIGGRSGMNSGRPVVGMGFR
jgi:hypothetical protein